MFKYRKASRPKFDPVNMREVIRRKISVDATIFLCSVGIKGTNNVRRILSSMTCKKDQAELANLKDKLGLKESAAGNPRAITLSRVMACFPEVIASIVYYRHPTMIVPYDELKAIHARFPAIARSEIGASILPTTLKPEHLHLALALFLVSSLKKSEIVSKKDKKRMEMKQKAKVEAALVYVKHLFMSKVLRDEVRNKAALEYGIVTQRGAEFSLTAAWTAAGSAALVWLKNNYGFDMTEEKEDTKNGDHSDGNSSAVK